MIKENEEINSLTGLYFSKYYFAKARKFIDSIDSEKYCMVAVDLEHFRLFNKLYGREQGDLLLERLGQGILEFSKEINGFPGYMGGDNFGIIMPYDDELIKRLRRGITKIIREWNKTVGFLPAIGVYKITNGQVPAMTMYDRATVALSNVIGNYAKRVCEYTPDMDKAIEEEIRLLTDVQEALARDEFTFFVQPQCDISTGKIVGGESLVRWKSKSKGMISPGVFVPVLEKNGFIADLDRLVWKKVCKWLRELIDKGYEPVPISINVSRIDVFSMDVPAYLTELLEKYDLPARLLKVEITESAYAENNDKIVRTVKQLQDANFLVMMDDFGSGYSSLNMLKSVAVDVLKIDMRFLEIDENEEEKGIGILESVVSMAKQMRIPIIVEGVETQIQENFLLKMGCRYTQGYYYYKPMPTEDFEKLLSDKRNLDLSGFWCRQIDSLRLKEFLDPNLFNDTLVNNILGPAAFYDMYENNIEIVRVNEQYFKLAGVKAREEKDYNRIFFNHVRDDDRQLLFSIFAQSHSNEMEGAQGYIHFVRNDGEILWVHIKVFFIREKGGHKLFYGSLTDMTEVHNNRKSGLRSVENKIDDVTEEQLIELQKHYENLPCGYGVIKLYLDDEGKPSDYDFIYANKQVNETCGGDMDRLRYLVSKTWMQNKEEVLGYAYRAAYLGEQVKYNVYSSLSCTYQEVTMFQYRHGYLSFMLQDVTHYRIYENTLSNVLKSFRAVYYLHLNDNHCRMIYPDENHLLERGNHYEVLNRHFQNGKIRPEDEENIRKFFDMENIRNELSTKESREYAYRRSIGDGAEEWCLTTMTVSEKENGVPKTAVITIRSIEGFMREKKYEKRKNMAKLLSAMDEGFFIYDESDEKVLYASPTVWNIYGCSTLEEFNEHVSGTFKGMVHPEDYNRVSWEINDQIKESAKKMDYITYRIVRKDGQVRWVDDCGHLIKSGLQGDSKLFYVLITDITDKMPEDDKNKLSMLSKKINDKH